MTRQNSLNTVSEVRALDAASGATFASVLVVRKLATKTAANGNPYLTVELGDRTGSFYSTVFSDSPALEALNAAGEGGVVRVEGRVETYQGRLSPRLLGAAVLDETELVDPALMENLVETAPENAGALWEDFEGYVASIRPESLQETVRLAIGEIEERFRQAPAAIAMHHAYRHGLLEHTIHMARACRALLPIYPEVDGDLALAGVLLHDIGKALEYEGSLATRRSRKGILQGHIVLGYQLVRKAGLRAQMDPDRLERLEHIILSHQGEPAWGAAVYAATPEAVFVARIDDLDAKMGMVQRALRQAAADSDFSERLPGLNTSLLTRPPTPAKDASSGQ